MNHGFHQRRARARAVAIRTSIDESRSVFALKIAMAAIMAAALTEAAWLAQGLFGLAH
jgi:hypothetical protein